MRHSDSIELRRLLPAPIEEVFRWWTEPELLREWMSPTGTVEASADLRVGGTLRILMKGEGRVIEHRGTYRELEPPRRLGFTWESEFTDFRTSLVTVELEARGEAQTLLRLIHAELPESAATSHCGGWSAMLDRLTGDLQRDAAEAP